MSDARGPRVVLATHNRGKLAELRDKRTTPDRFRRAATRISVLLAAEAMRDVPSGTVTVFTQADATFVKAVKAKTDALEDAWIKAAEGRGLKDAKKVLAEKRPKGAKTVEAPKIKPKTAPRTMALAVNSAGDCVAGT